MQVAVIGAGWWGKNIINTFEDMGTVKRVHVFDHLSDTLGKFQKNKKLVYSESYENILKNSSIQAVCIATPPKTHYDLTKAALLSGKHVLVEKPPAYSFQQIDELGKIARTHNLLYMLDAVYLFLEPIQQIKKIIETGKMHDILMVQIYRIGDELRREGSGLERIQKGMYDNGTDVVEDLFFHDAGILFYLFNELSFQKAKKFYLYNPSICDTAIIHCQSRTFPVQLTLSWTNTGRRRGLSIYGREQILEYNGLASENQVTLYSILNQKNETFSFPANPPLKSLLEYFVSKIAKRAPVEFDSNFMSKIVKLWRMIDAVH